MSDDAEDELLQARGLPDPTLTFTLPSIHDGTTLDCRIYHPSSLSISPRATPWRRHAAIVAHPYAPLGGSWDDHIVDLVASTLLRLGYLVCTFNFRGATGSAGRTSWTAKAERADYMSVVGFVAHYVHFLDPFRQAEPDARPPELPDNRHTPVLLLAGYSYGAMITAQLPDLDTILAVFKTPISGSPAAEIRLRAEYMADAENTVLGSARAAALDRQGGMSPRKAMAMRVGGDEQNRKSHELGRRSFSLEAEEKFRDMLAKAKKGHKAESSASPTPKKTSTPKGRSVSNEDAKRETEKRLQALSTMTKFQPAYLLISPLQGMVMHLATMSFSNAVGKKTDDRPSKASPDDTTSPAHSNAATWAWEAEQKLTSNPTLAVFGDQDVFVPVKKLRDWVRRLQAAPESRFRGHEISTAGHFWTEDGVYYIMRSTVKAFAEGLLASEHMPEPRAQGHLSS